MMNIKTHIMTDRVNSMEHANSTNPCEGYCQTDEKYCGACFRTEEERAKWYTESNDWREMVLVEIETRKGSLFDGR